MHFGAEAIGHVAQAVAIAFLAGRAAIGAAMRLGIVEAPEHRIPVERGDAQRERLVTVVDQLRAGVFRGDDERPRGPLRHLSLTEAAHRHVARRLGVDRLERNVVNAGEVGKRDTEFAPGLAGFAVAAVGRYTGRVGVAVRLVQAGRRYDDRARRGRPAVLALRVAPGWARCKRGDLRVARATAGHGIGREVGAADQRAGQAGIGALAARRVTSLCRAAGIGQYLPHRERGSHAAVERREIGCGRANAKRRRIAQRPAALRFDGGALRQIGRCIGTPDGIRWFDHQRGIQSVLLV